MPNYASAILSAKRQINAAGRNITLVRLDFDAPAANKPWEVKLDPRATPTRTLSTKAVFVPVASLPALGLSKQAMDMAKKAKQTCIVSVQEDLGVFNEVLDSKDGLRYKIMLVDILAPGNVTVLQFIVMDQ